MTVDPLKILNNRFSIYYDGVEVLKNLVVIDIEVNDRIPPYDHIAYSFRAMVLPEDFTFFDGLAREGLIISKNCLVRNGDFGCPVYIDSYEIIETPIDISNISSHTLTLPRNEIIISGHVDSRDLEVIVEKDEPIFSRFEILDL